MKHLAVCRRALRLTRRLCSPATAWLTDWPDQKLAREGVAHHRCAVRCLHEGRANTTTTLGKVMLAEAVDAVIGVDTLADTHTARLINMPSGGSSLPPLVLAAVSVVEQRYPCCLGGAR